jgi:hypothetical protein
MPLQPRRFVFDKQPAAVALLLAFLALFAALFAPSAWAGVTVNSDGWTDITASADSRLVYVDGTAGNDSNSGLTTLLPKRTIASAIGVTRQGYPDWVLLKRGTAFDESIDWPRRGRSSTEPCVLTAYGTGARPIVRPPTGQPGLQAINNGGAYFAITGVEFYARSRDPNAGTPNVADAVGINWFGAGTTLIVEDCKISYFTNAVVLTGPSETSLLVDPRIRRNVLADSYSVNAHGQGLYATEVKSLELRENFILHCGWNASITGAEKTIFNHGVYLDNENDRDTDGTGNLGTFVVTGNLIAESSSHAMQVRCGGTITNNLAISNPCGVLIGGGQDFGTTSPAGVLGNASNNVILLSNDIGTGDLVRGYGLDIVNTRSGSTVTGNIIAHDGSASPHANAHGVSIDAPATLAYTNNIVWNWTAPYTKASGATVTASGNYAGALGGPNTPGYTDPARTIGGYAGSIGLTATADAYYTACRAQSRANWRTDLLAASANAYIRAGFAVSGGGSPSDTTAPTAAATLGNVSSSGGTSYSFSVTYTDDTAVNATTIGSGDVRITGPGGYSATATLSSVDVGTNGTPRVATYTVTPPSGAWAYAHNGTYTASMIASQVSDTAGNFVAAGSLGTFTVSIAAPSTAAIVAPDVTLGGAITHDILVTYTAAAGVKVSTLDSNDVRVTGPRGVYNVLARFVAVDTASNGTPRTAAYRITPPGGNWDASDNGVYTVSLRPGQVTDINGAAITVPDATFTVNVTTLDVTRPSAVVTASGISVAGGTSYTFTVTYRDDQAVRADTFGSDDITITGPFDWGRLAAYVSTNTVGNGAVRIVTYAMTPPGGTWDAGDNGTYSVAVRGGHVADTAGNTILDAKLGSFVVNIAGSASLPDTSLSVLASGALKVSVGGTAVCNDTVRLVDVPTLWPATPARPSVENPADGVSSVVVWTLSGETALAEITVTNDHPTLDLPWVSVELPDLTFCPAATAGADFGRVEAIAASWLANTWTIAHPSTRQPFGAWRIATSGPNRIGWGFNSIEDEETPKTLIRTAGIAATRPLYFIKKPVTHGGGTATIKFAIVASANTAATHLWQPYKDSYAARYDTEDHYTASWEPVAAAYAMTQVGLVSPSNPYGYKAQQDMTGSATAYVLGNVATCKSLGCQSLILWDPSGFELPMLNPSFARSRVATAMAQVCAAAAPMQVGIGARFGAVADSAGVGGVRARLTSETAALLTEWDRAAGWGVAGYYGDEGGMRPDDMTFIKAIREHQDDASSTMPGFVERLADVMAPFVGGYTNVYVDASKPEGFRMGPALTAADVAAMHWLRPGLPFVVQLRDVPDAQLESAMRYAVANGAIPMVPWWDAARQVPVYRRVLADLNPSAF